MLLTAVKSVPTIWVVPNGTYTFFQRNIYSYKKFEPLFTKAGYSMNDAVNKVYVAGHKGPHPEAYHQAVYKALLDATNGLSGEKYKTAFDSTLKELATQAQTVGSYLNKLLTKTN
jgi:hypothetical protein